VDRHPLTGREVHLVRYPRGEVREPAWAAELMAGYW